MGRPAALPGGTLVTIQWGGAAQRPGHRMNRRVVVGTAEWRERLPGDLKGGHLAKECGRYRLILLRRGYSYPAAENPSPCCL